MNDLSTEVKAKETHENAKFYYGRAEFNLYKSTMEIKRIRDERFYKELGFSNFDDYCREHWDVGRQTMDERIQIANTFSEEDFASYNLQFGHNKTLLLSRMDEQQREQATTKGVPTEEGYKPIDKATQKEIAEYRRNAEEAERRAEQAEKQAEQAQKSEKIALRKLEEVESKEPEVIEKEVIKEVVPESLSEQMESLKRQLNFVSKENDELRIENDSYKMKDTTEFDEEAAEWELKKLQNEADRNATQVRLAIKKLNNQIAVSKYMYDAISVSSDYEKREMKKEIDILKDIITGIESSLKNRKVMN